MSNKTKTYNVNFPVYKQGDDLSHWLKETNGDPQQALILLADQYREAAKIADKVAGFWEKGGFSDLLADCHLVCFEAANSQYSQELETDEYIGEQNFEEE